MGRRLKGIMGYLAMVLVLAGCNIEGTVTTQAGTGLAGVTVMLSGTQSMTAVTDASGKYTFSNLPAGSYTVTPQMTGYVFEPPSKNVAKPDSNTSITGVDFLARVPVVTWSRTYGGSGNESGALAQQTSDGGYVTAGYRPPAAGGAKADIWLVKTDGNGTVAWDRTFPGAVGNNLVESMVSMQQTSDGGYIIAGNVIPVTGTTGQEMWLIKTDGNGNQLWRKSLAGNVADTMACLRQTADGGYIIAGNGINTGSGNEVWLKQVDQNGNDMWTLRYATMNPGTYPPDDIDRLYSVQETNDQGFILCGSTFIHAKGQMDYLLMKTDSNGALQWSRNYDGNGNDVCLAAMQTKDGGYILNGVNNISNETNDAWIIKTDMNGNKQWEKTVTGTGNAVPVAMVRQTNDQGYILGGSSSSSGAGGYDVCLMKLDAGGALQWEKYYGGSADDGCVAVMQTADNGYLVAGSTLSFGSGGSDVWLIKTDEAGNAPAAPTR